MGECVSAKAELEWSIDLLGGSREGLGCRYYILAGCQGAGAAIAVAITVENIDGDRAGDTAAASIVIGGGFIVVVGGWVHAAVDVGTASIVFGCNGIEVLGNGVDASRYSVAKDEGRW